MQLAILTGQRRGEVAAMRRSWIADGTVVFPDGIAKNKREHMLPLPPTAIQLIDQLPHSHDRLFPSRTNSNKPFNGRGKCKSQFDEPIDVKSSTLHDLRRTFSSNMAMLGTPIHVTEKILNHISGTIIGFAAINNRYCHFDEMRETLWLHDNFFAR